VHSVPPHFSTQFCISDEIVIKGIFDVQSEVDEG
jgi:hypothetical protein